MEEIKDNQELSNEFNRPLKNEIKPERLELGIQSLDFGDQTLDHELIGDLEDGFAKKLSEMTVKGLSGEDEGSELVLATETEGDFDKGKNFGEGGENDQGGLGGFRNGVEFGSKLCENENRVGDRDLKGLINDEAKFEERKIERLGGVEGNKGEYKETKEGGEDKDGSKWSEIENEGGDRELEGIKNEAEIKERNLEKCCVVEGNERDFKEMKEGEVNEGSKWSEIENEDGDLDLAGIEDEAEIEERNLEKRNVEEGKEGAFKEINEGDKDEGSNWSEIGNEGGDCDLKGIENEMAIEERNPENRIVVEGNEIGSNWSEIGNEGGDCDLKGIEDEIAIEERTPENHSVVVEGNEGALKEIKGGDKDREGFKWREIGNEVGDRDLEGIKDETAIEERNPENLSVVEGNEGAFKEIKEGDKDIEGSKWSEIGNEDGDHDLEGIKDETEVKERNTEKRSVVEENEGGEIKNEGNDRDLQGIKDEAKIKQGNPEKRSMVEENEVDFKEMKEGRNDKEGSNWGEIEDAEEIYIREVKNRRADKGKEVIEDYEDDWTVNWDDVIEDYEDGWGENGDYVIEDSEDGWGENWDDGAVTAKANQERQCFNNYEKERDINDKGPHWYRNAEKDSGGSNDENFGRHNYPLRPDAEACSFYMRTGTCRFGLDCKFNHPLERKNQAVRDTFKQKEEIYDKPRQTECKYYLSPGGCKYGKACRYSHGKGKAAVTPNLELNFIGLPIRVGEKECSFYMRTGTCKYGRNCKFHHPNSTAAAGGETNSPGRGRSSASDINESAPFRPIIFPPENAERNGYQASAYGRSQGILPVPPALSMTIPATGSSFDAHPQGRSSFYANPQGQVKVDEYPQRPGQPECSFYMRTGDCKYKSSCRFHHPRNPETAIPLSNLGLPLRPGQRICSHFGRYGICKYGPLCEYDHPVGGNAASSVRSDQGRNFEFPRFEDEHEEWEPDAMEYA